MISTQLQGGLGNQLFQMSAAIGLAFRNEDEAAFDISSFGDTVQGFNPNKYVENVFREVSFKTNLSIAFNCQSDPNRFDYEEIPYVKHTRLIGYFQSHKYFEDCREVIIDTFRPTEDVIDKFKKEVLCKSIATEDNVLGPTCSIHVRRGSYVQDAIHHPPCEVEYYRQAMEDISSQYKGTTFLVFSDDKQWCEENLLPLANKDMFIEFHSNFEDWEEMWFMSLCDHNIIANSSFSWWSAYLNENPHKKVIYPSKWFGPAYAHFDTKDLCPEEWKKI